MAKHFDLAITDTTLAITRHQANIDAEAALDGIYVIRTSVPADQLDPAGVVTAYKNLSHVERDFRNIKVDDLDLRPIHHRLADRVKAHVLICMLAAYLIWHLRRALAPADLHRRAPTHPQQPRRPRPTLHRRSPQSQPPTRPSTTSPTTASAACSPTWPPSPATTSATAPRPPTPSSPPSPSRPPPNAEPSNSSAPPSPSPSRSQNTTRPKPRPTTQNSRSTGLRPTARHWEDHVTSD